MASPKATAVARVKKRIVPVSQSQPYARVLLYGRNGKGKTRIAASLRKTLVVDCNEEGTLSVSNYPEVEVFPAKSWADFVHAYWFLKEGDHKYESVVIDTLTQAQKLCMTSVLKKADDRDPNRPPSTPTQPNWNQMSELMTEQILNYRNLPMHVVFVCQERIDKNRDDEDAAVRYVPDLSPAVRGTAMGAVSIMGRVYMRPVRRGKGKKEVVKWETRMLVGPHDDYETKDRSYKLGHIVRNPTMKMIVDAAKYIKPEEE